MNSIRPTWAEVDLHTIARNIEKTRQLLQPGTLMMAVVKANAYGHGMVEVAKTAVQAGAEYLGVATLDEALILRRHGLKAPIMVLGYTPAIESGPAIDENVALTVLDLDTALIIADSAVRAGKVARVHIKVDTGMNRIGFQPGSESLGAVAEISQLPGLKLEGIFSHFSVSDIEDKSFSKRQLAVFTEFCTQLKEIGVDPPLKHIANSAAIIDLPESHLNMVRAGIMIYGFYPSHDVQKSRIDLEPAMRLYSRVAQVKNIYPGDTVSYGRTFEAEEPLTVATIPIGYADGYSRLLSNRIWAIIRGQRARQIGTICMDQCMFDVSHIDGVAQGDPVLLFGAEGDGVTADDIAGVMGTINYEIVCKISARVPRVFIG